jgi:hypothetical protein
MARPGREQLEGVGAGLVGLADEGEQRPGEHRGAKERRLAPRAIQPKPGNGAEGNGQCRLHQAELGEASEGVPVVGDEEGDPGRDQDGPEPKQELVDEPPPLGPGRQRAAHGKRPPHVRRSNPPLLRPAQDVPTRTHY